MAAAERDARVILLGSDVTGSLGLADFASRFPRQFISLGIAEQNAAGVAAGLALAGLRPVFATYATFATTRALDQIRVSICYNGAPVLIGGAHAGISVGPDGATHQALEDIATTRVLPGMRVVSPCDANQTTAATLALLTAEHPEPTYIRFGREAVPNFTDPAAPFELGAPITLATGKDVTIVATGHMVYHALVAADILAERGVSAEVINVHTIKPLPDSFVATLAQARRPIVTVEEHQAAGGLGSAILEGLAPYGAPPVAVMGVHDTFGQSGSPEALMVAYYLTGQDIAKRAQELLAAAH